MEELNSGPPKTNLSSGRVEDLNPGLVPVLVYVFNIDLFEFSAAILEKGLSPDKHVYNVIHRFQYFTGSKSNKQYQYSLARFIKF